MGRGNRQMCDVDKYEFSRKKKNGRKGLLIDYLLRTRQVYLFNRFSPVILG